VVPVSFDSAEKHLLLQCSIGNFLGFRGKMFFIANSIAIDIFLMRKPYAFGNDFILM